MPGVKNANVSPETVAKRQRNLERGRLLNLWRLGDSDLVTPWEGWMIRKIADRILARRGHETATTTVLRQESEAWGDV